MKISKKEMLALKITTGIVLYSIITFLINPWILLWSFGVFVCLLLLCILYVCIYEMIDNDKQW